MSNKRTLADLPPLAERRRDEMIVAAEVAIYLGVETSTVERWRTAYRGRQASGPPYRRLGNGPKATVRYQVGELVDWIASRAVQPEAPVQAA